MLCGIHPDRRAGRFSISLLLALALAATACAILTILFVSRSPDDTSEGSAQDAPGSAVAEPTEHVDAHDDDAASPSSAKSAPEVVASTLHGGLVRHALTGEGIADAVIELHERVSDRDVVLEATRTDRAGRFHLTRHVGVGSMVASLRVTHPEYVPARRSLHAGVPAVIELVPGLRITGEVIDTAGHRVPGGEVHVLSGLHASMHQRESGVEFVYRADHTFQVPVQADGTFRAVVGADTVACWALCPGRGLGFSEIVVPDPDGDIPIVIRIEAGSTLTGLVTDQEGRPVEGATVTAGGQPADRVPDRLFTIAHRWSGVTGADGRFTIRDLTPFIASVEVRHPTHQNDRWQGLASTTEPRTIVLEAGQALTGVLLDPTGAPLSPRHFVLEDDRTVEVKVEDGGVFHCGPLPLTATSVQLTVPGYVPIALHWEPTPGQHDVGTHPLSRGRCLEVLVRAGASAAPAAGAPAAGSPAAGSPAAEAPVAGAPVADVTDVGVPVAEAPLPGTPVAGASVALSVQPSGANWWSPRQVQRTDAEGLALLCGLTTPQVQVRVEADGYAASEQLFTVPPVTSAAQVENPVESGASAQASRDPGDPPPMRIEITLRPAASIMGRVQTPDGTGIVAARIAATWFTDTLQRASRNVRTSTGEDGRFALEVPPDSELKLSVVLSAQRLEQSVPALAAGERRELPTLTCTELLSVHGRVVDPTGRGIGHARVMLSSLTDLSFDATRALATCDPEGRFAVDLAPGPYQCAVHAAGFVNHSSTVRFPSPDGAPLALVLEPGVTFQGRVVDETGAPVVEARVSVSRNEFTAGMTTSALTDEDGHYQLVDLQDGPIRLIVHHRDHRAQNASAARPAALPETIVLLAGATLVVELQTADGTPLPAAVEIELEGANWRSTSQVQVQDGEATIKGLEERAGKIQVRALGLATSESLPVALTLGVTTRVVAVLSTSKVDPVVFRVLGRDEPVAGARLEFFEVRGQGGFFGRGLGGATDADGVFICTTPLGPGTAVRVDAAGYATTTVQDVLGLQRGDEIVIQLAPASQILVRVLDARGLAVSGLRIGCWSTDSPQTLSPRGPMGNATTDANGETSIDGLGAGAWRLSVQRGRDQLATEQVTLQQGERREVVIALADEIRVSGRVTENGAPVLSGSVSLSGSSSGGRVEAPLDGEGRFELSVIGPGAYQLRYRDQGLFISEPRRIEGPCELTLALRTTRLDLQVVDPSDKPLPGVSGWITGVGSTSFETDAGGRYVTERLPLGDYTIRVQQASAGLFAPPLAIVVDGPTVAVLRMEPALRVVLDVTLPPGLPPGDARLTVDIVIDGKLHRVNALPDGSYAWPQTGGTGIVRAKDLAPAVFAVFQETPPANSSITVPVTLHPGGQLLVTLHDGAGLPRDGVAFTITPVGTLADAPALPDILRHWTSGSQGSRTLSLAPGRYRVSTPAEDGSEVSSTVEVIAGQRAECRLP